MFSHSYFKAELHQIGHAPSDAEEKHQNYDADYTSDPEAYHLSSEDSRNGCFVIVCLVIGANSAHPPVHSDPKCTMYRIDTKVYPLETLVADPHQEAATKKLKSVKSSKNKSGVLW